METENVQPLKVAAQFASEFVVPGGSNFIKGDFVTGALHTLIGFAARSFLGVPGMLMVSANSFAKATTGRDLVASLRETFAKSEPAPPPSA